MERETLKTLTVFMISLIIRLTIAVQGILREFTELIYCFMLMALEASC